MRILFVNAIDVSSEVETRYPNLGLGYLVSALRSGLGDTSLAFRIIDRNIEKEIQRFRPDIVGLTCVTQNYNRAIKYAAVAKSHGLPVIMGGIHISMLPDSLSPDMDVGCLGEGERTIVELASIFKNKGGFLPQDLSRVNGIVYHKGGRRVTGPPSTTISPLDAIPLPARDVLPIQRHSYMFTSRGCPYDCVFCASTRFWGAVRYFSAGYVVREIHELVERYHVRIISFFDDLFIGNVSRLRQIADLLEGREALNKVKFTCSARANLITEDTAALLKRMRVFSVGMGLESGSDETLSYLKGHSTSVETNKRALTLLRKYGIAPNASFVIGSPRETLGEIKKTYHFIKDNPICLFDTYVLTPYPGTAVWDDAKARGLVSDSMDWDRLNVNFAVNRKNGVLLSEVLSRKALIRIYRSFQILRFFKNARNVWFSPQIFDLPRIIGRTSLEYIARIVSKERRETAQGRL